MLAINEYKEFLSLFPTHKRVDYAQYKLAMSHFYQMRDPMRDQTETVEAIKELMVFVERFPERRPQPALSRRPGQAAAKPRTAWASTSWASACSTTSRKWYPGAIERLKTLARQGPAVHPTGCALFYLADSYDKVGRPAEALPYYDRLIKEFEKSEFLDKAQARVTAIRAEMDKKTGAVPQ